MLEERESVFLLYCCHRLLRARAAPGTNGASSGPLFPSDGHSWGRSATQSWGYTPLSTPSCRLLPPAPAFQSCCATAGPEPSVCCTALAPNRRGGGRVISRRGWTTVMSTVRLISALSKGRLHCLTHFHVAGPPTVAKRQTCLNNMAI